MLPCVEDYYFLCLKTSFSFLIKHTSLFKIWTKCFPQHFTYVAQTYIISRKTMPAENELIHSSLSHGAAEGIERSCCFLPKDKTTFYHKTCSPHFSSCRTRGTRLQYNVSRRSHRRVGTHLREEHSASGSCHSRWPPEGRRQVAGGEEVKVVFYTVVHMCAGIHVVS